MNNFISCVVLIGMNTKLDFHLQGAPNFRVADLNVYGVAQPTVTFFNFIQTRVFMLL